MVSPISRFPLKLEKVSSKGRLSGLCRRPDARRGLGGLAVTCPEVSTIGEECALVIGGADSELRDERERRWLLEYGDRFRGRKGKEVSLFKGGVVAVDGEYDGSVNRRGE